MPLDATDATAEIAAMEAAYNALAELDLAARRRGFTWLAEVLGHPDITLPTTGDVISTASPVPAESR